MMRLRRRSCAPRPLPRRNLPSARVADPCVAVAAQHPLRHHPHHLLHPGELSGGRLWRGSWRRGRARGASGVYARSCVPRAMVPTLMHAPCLATRGPSNAFSSYCLPTPAGPGACLLVSPRTTGYTDPTSALPRCARVEWKEFIPFVKPAPILEEEKQAKAKSGKGKAAKAKGGKAKGGQKK